ncbi:MAG: hypothetical protein E6Z07_08555, partial [Finegoldia magna]|nr:hypothetical protein [Finegoldia magna]
QILVIKVYFLKIKKISAHNLSGGADTQNFSHTPEFHPLGVFPTSFAIVDTLSFISRSIPLKFSLIISISISEKNSLILSTILNILF